MPTHKSLGEVSGLLQHGIALSCDLERQAKQAHWTVRGPNFSSTHKHFDKVAEAAERFTDLCAERLIAVGGVADGTTSTVAAQTTLVPISVELQSADRLLEHMAQILETYARFARDAILRSEAADDLVSGDIFTDISREVDQLRWQTEAHKPVTSAPSDRKKQ
jgi:starvation-inducible DNA-binding protein